MALLVRQLALNLCPRSTKLKQAILGYNFRRELIKKVFI
jgi:hypothetical protein